MPNYTLQLFTPLKLGKAYIRDITDVAEGWSRTTKLQGGFWMGQFRLSGKAADLREWISYRGAHVQEKSGGVITWEGYIDTIDVTPGATPVLDVIVYGYVFTINNKYASDGGDDEIGVTERIKNILLNNVELVTVGRLDSNTLQVPQKNSVPQKAFDEIMRFVELGDIDGNPWRFFVAPGPVAVFEAISNAPRYYVRGGVKRRYSLALTYNYVRATYIDNEKKMRSTPIEQNLESINKYGTREYRVFKGVTNYNAAVAMQKTVLKENCWPWGRPVETAPGTPIYTMAQNNTAHNPWRIQPAVVRDLSFSMGGGEYEGWLADVRDFLVDEVSVSAANGVQLRSGLFEEAELMELQYRTGTHAYVPDPDAGKNPGPYRPDGRPRKEWWEYV